MGAPIQPVRVGIQYWIDENGVRHEGPPPAPPAPILPKFPLFPSLLAGGIPLIGGIISNIMQNKQAERQMRFQREMSNTAYSRAARDMRGAGINPLLGFQGPASTPQGAQAQIGNPLADTVSSALAARNMQRDLARLMLEGMNSTAGRELKRAQATKAGTSAAVDTANKALLDARATSATQQAAFDQWIGTLGPAGRFIAEMIRALAGSLR